MHIIVLLFSLLLLVPMAAAQANQCEQATVFDTMDRFGCKADFRLFVNQTISPDNTCFDTDGFDIETSGDVSLFVNAVTTSYEDYCVHTSDVGIPLKSCVGIGCAVTETICISDSNTQTALIPCSAGCTDGQCIGADHPLTSTCASCVTSGECTKDSCEATNQCTFTNVGSMVQCNDIMCTDTDYLNTSIQGTTKRIDIYNYTLESSQDYCDGATSVIEYRCDGSAIASENVYCEHGCEQGRCLPEPIIVCATVYEPVCVKKCSSCDEETMSNQCEADKIGAVVQYSGECRINYVLALARAMNDEVILTLNGTLPSQSDYLAIFRRLTAQDLTTGKSYTPPQDPTSANPAVIITGQPQTTPFVVDEALAQQIMATFNLVITTDNELAGVLDFLKRPDVVTQVIELMEAEYEQAYQKPKYGYEPSHYLTLYPGLVHGDFLQLDAQAGYYDFTTKLVFVSTGTNTSIARTLPFNSKKAMVRNAAARLDVILLTDGDGQRLLDLLRQEPRCNLVNIRWSISPTEQVSVKIETQGCNFGTLSIYEKDPFSKDLVEESNIFLSKKVTVPFTPPEIKEIDGIEEFQAVLHSHGDTITSSILQISAQQCPDGSKGDYDKDLVLDCFDTDDDNDGVADDIDNCPLTYNPGQFDADRDGIGNVCDNDADNDGIVNSLDVCPYSTKDVLVNVVGCELIVPITLLDENGVQTVMNQDQPLGWYHESLDQGYRAVSPNGKLYYFEQQLTGTPTWLLTQIRSLGGLETSIEYKSQTVIVSGNTLVIAQPTLVHDHTIEDQVTIEYEDSPIVDDNNIPISRVKSSELVIRRQSGVYWRST